MVLDTFNQDRDLLIFKNTYDDEASGQPKQFTIERTHPNALNVLFFVHIKIKDLNNLPSQEQRAAEREAEIKDLEGQLRYLRNEQMIRKCQP